MKTAPQTDRAFRITYIRSFPSVVASRSFLTPRAAFWLTLALMVALHSLDGAL
jgi:hypothetical protein